MSQPARAMCYKGIKLSSSNHWEGWSCLQRESLQIFRSKEQRTQGMGCGPWSPGCCCCRITCLFRCYQGSHHHDRLPMAHKLTTTCSYNKTLFLLLVWTLHLYLHVSVSWYRILHQLSAMDQQWTFMMKVPQPEHWFWNLSLAAWGDGRQSVNVQWSDIQEEKPACLIFALGRTVHLGQIPLRFKALCYLGFWHSSFPRQ